MKVKKTSWDRKAPAENIIKKENPSKRTVNPYLDFKNLDCAAETSFYYGFMPIETPTIKKEDVSAAKKILSEAGKKTNYGSHEECPISISAEEKIAILRTCFNKNLLSSSQPAMVYYENQIIKDGEKKSQLKQYKKIGLDIIGTTKSIAEAILIQTALEIIKDEGYKDIYIDINSVGDKESINNFTRELNAFNRKHLGELAAPCRHEIHHNIFHILQCKNKRCEELAEEAPKSVNSLSDLSRLHLKEVLEYVESLNVPYKLDNGFLGEYKTVCHTTFRLVSLGSDNQPEETVAVGFRYNGLSKKAEITKDLPAVGLNIVIKKTNKTKKQTKNPKKPKIYFIQLGFEAKTKSLKVIEVLRKAKIPLYQSLSRDKLSSQIGTAENLKVPIVIIMGQKEAIENSVIIRDMNTRFQENVSIDELAEHIKKFKLA